MQTLRKPAELVVLVLFKKPRNHHSRFEVVLDICLFYQFIFAFLPHLEESLIYKCTWHATSAAPN